MGYKKPIPVEINKIVIGKKYYTCSYSGTISVIILKIFIIKMERIDKRIRCIFNPFSLLIN